jgi:hypothetical protein
VLFTEYYKTDKGEAVKKMIKVKVVNVEKKVYDVSMTRGRWRRVGGGGVQGFGLMWPCVRASSVAFVCVCGGMRERGGGGQGLGLL